jgi:hypothetical protein
MAGRNILNRNRLDNLAGNLFQIKFARTSWRETLVKLNSPTRPAARNNFGLRTLELLLLVLDHDDVTCDAFEIVLWYSYSNCIRSDSLPERASR